MTQTITPKTIATTIITEDSHAWIVKCEDASCTNGVRVSKRSGLPNGGTLEYTAPSVRRCGLHGIR